MSRRGKTLVAALVAVALAGFVGCGGGCDVGESWCDEDLVIECVYDPDDDYEDDEECGLLCALIELADHDTYGEVVLDCAPSSKTCHEVEDADGYTFAECGFRDFDDHLY